LDLSVQGLSLTAAQWRALFSLRWNVRIVEQVQSDPQVRQTLRDMMRQRRRELDAQTQLEAAKQLSQHLTSQPWYQRAQHIAVYIANDGEIDPIVFSHRAMHRGKQCYLPVLHPMKKGHLQFADYNGPKVVNSFGIEEPDVKQCRAIDVRKIDVVLLPLVAFDQQGERLGMGGGYYDRTFEFLRRSGLNKPKLIGLAHDFQQVDAIPTEAWDVPLTAIVTNKGVIKASG